MLVDKELLTDESLRQVTVQVMVPLWTRTGGKEWKWFVAHAWSTLFITTASV